MVAYRPIIYHIYIYIYISYPMIYPRPISSLPVSLPEGGREGGQGGREGAAEKGGREGGEGGGGRPEGRWGRGGRRKFYLRAELIKCIDLNEGEALKRGGGAGGREVGQREIFPEGGIDQMH